MKIIRQKITALLAKNMLSFFARLSLKNVHRIGRVLGWLFYKVPNRSLSVSQKNIQLCFPEMSQSQQQQLIKNSLIETGKTLTESGPMWLWNKEKLLSLVTKVHGEEHIQKAIDNNQGVIIAIPHLGNWELLGLYCSAHYPSTSMYQKHQIKQLDIMIKEGREHLGATLVPTDSKGVRAMYSALKNQQLVCILPDQVPTQGSGVFADFFGIPAYSMTLTSRLAKKTNAQVLLAYTKRLNQGTGYEIYFNSLESFVEKTMDESATYLNTELEKCIRLVPEQYQWSYKRFRVQPKDKKGNSIADYYNS
ncbi:MAG: lysophospholipid acyltransferase family protein [Woeseiaceae bacterium]